MGFLDKLKHIFDDEEDEEVKEPPKKMEPVEIRTVAPKAEPKKEEEPSPKSDPNFKFPVIFEEEDFVVKEKQKAPAPKVSAPQPDKNRVKERMRKKEEERKDLPKEKFRSSPIISPVYGVLDKNYKKEDVTSRRSDLEIDDISIEKKIDVDSVRQKAYGTLIDDIEDTLFDNKILFTKIEESETTKKKADNGLLSDLDLLKEETPKDDDNFEDFGVEYSKKEITVEIPLEQTMDLVDDKERNRSSKNTSNNDDLINDDLFNLIDSMYKDEEGEEDK